MAGLGLRASQGPCHWLQIETPLFSELESGLNFNEATFYFPGI